MTDDAGRAAAKAPPARQAAIAAGLWAIVGDSIMLVDARVASGRRRHAPSAAPR